MDNGNVRIAIERVLGSGMLSQEEIFTEKQKAKIIEAILAALEAFDKQKK